MPLLIDMGRIRGHRTRRLATNIGVMGPVRHPPDENILEENTLYKCQVVEMGATVERVVHGVLHAWFNPIGEGVEHSRNRCWHRAKVNRNVFGLRQHLARRHEHRGGTVDPLLDVWRVSGPAQNRTHFLSQSGESVASNLECDRINTDHGRPVAGADSRTREPEIMFRYQSADSFGARR